MKKYFGKIIIALLLIFLTVNGQLDCKNGIDNDGVCSCKNGGTYDETNGCECSNEATYDPQNGCCKSGATFEAGVCSCKNGGTYDETNGCCKSGATLGENGQCQCPQGLQLFQDKCVDQCQLGKSRHPNGTCVTSCLQGLQLFNNSCVAKCQTGYKRNVSGVCILSCPQGQKNNGLGICALQCADGFKDDGRNQGFCISLDSSCYPSYRDDGRGNVCVPISAGCFTGFQLNNGVCILSQSPSPIQQVNGTYIKCDPLCVQCNTDGKCNVCQSGYVLNTQTSQCVFCNGCKSCLATNPSNCSSCFAPQVLDKNTCVNPTCSDKNCLMCDIEGKCTLCSRGYAVSGSGCAPCSIKNCIECKSSVNTCDTCREGLVSFNQKCLPCSASCKTCKISDITQCLSCNSGMYLATVKNKAKCSKCFSNCADCSQATTCNRCIEGYVLSSDKSKCSIACSSSCATCDSTDPNKCTGCFAGTQLIQSSSTCSQNLSCNQTSTCIGCPQGFVLNEKKCYQCTYTDSSCISCTYQKLNTCASCKYGYYLKAGACEICPGNCQYCIGSGQCVKCNAGYWIERLGQGSTGVCKQCDSPCKTCENGPKKCTSCIDKHNLQDTSCISVNNVQLKTTLNTDLADILNIMDKVYSWILEIVNRSVKQGQKLYTEDEIVIQQISQGSVNIDFAVSVSDPSAVQAIASDFTQALSQGTQIGGVAISGSAVANQEPQTQTSSSDSSSNVGLILGIVIPLGIIVLIGVIVIIIKVYGKKKSYQDENKGDNSYDMSGKNIADNGESEKI